jgi:hypothetical protein
MPADAAEPGLAVYVTDDDRDVFVAILDGIAIELSGCAGETAARTLLQLPAAAPLAETTLDALTADNALGSHPRIPCGPDAAFDADLPATTPVWADLTGTRRYYLAGPGAAGAYYSIPTDCNAIKAAFAIRERIQLPGVLKGQALPPDLATEVALGCGQAVPGDGAGPVGDTPAAAAWSLHKVDTFLSAESIGDSIYVARYTVANADGELREYLPVHRIDGASAHEAIWAGGDRTRRTESALRELFGIAADAAITPLDFEALGRIQQAVHVDLCLTDCQGYIHRHAYFANPGVDLELTEVRSVASATEMNVLGRPRSVWTFADGRRLVLSGCDRLGEALGLEDSEPAAWPIAVEAALIGLETPQPTLACDAAEALTCVRQVADGGQLTAALAAASPDCAGATRLRLELAATAVLPRALVLTNIPFAEMETRPADGVARSLIRAVPSVPPDGVSACLFAPAPGLIVAASLPHLMLSRLDIVREADGPAGEVAALQVEKGTVALDRVSIGAAGEGRMPVERAVRLCNAELYVGGGQIEATALAIQAASSLVLVAGLGSEPADARGGRFGILLATGSAARLHRVTLVSPNPFVLRDATLTATRADLTAGAGSPGDAIRLERGARADLTQSTAAGFRCLGIFFDASASASFVLPGNDLARDNDHTSCGSSTVAIVE